MRRPFTRAHQQARAEMPAPQPAVETRVIAGRTDLTCASCHKVIAYGVRAERVLADAGFFLEAHRPFCIAVAVSA